MGFFTYAILLRLIRGLVELVEQEQEHDGMHANPPDERLRIVALDEQQLEGMHHDRHKLHLNTPQRRVIEILYMMQRNDAIYYVIGLHYTIVSLMDLHHNSRHGERDAN